MEGKDINLRFLFNLEHEGPRKVVEWCMEVGLLVNRVECEVCGKEMVLKQVGRVSDKCQWECRTTNNPHYKKVSVRKNSLFYNSASNISVLLLMTYMWVNNCSQMLICMDLHLAKQTVTDWIRCCRTICLEACANEKEMIGGLGIEVEVAISEMSDLNRRKHLNGKWVVRGIEKNSRKSFFRLADNPIALEVSSIFKECLRPGSVIIAEWERYDWCDETSFISATSNYGLVFKDQANKVQNNYSGTWGSILKSIKSKNKCLGFDRQDLHFAEYIWKKKHADNRFASFVSAIKDLFSVPVQNKPADKPMKPECLDESMEVPIPTIYCEIKEEAEVITS